MKKQVMEVENENAEEEFETLEDAATVTMNSVAQANRRLSRMAYYSAVASVVCMILAIWFVGAYAARLETQVYDSNAQTFQQMENRLAALESAARPAKPKPTFVQFTPPSDAPRKGSADAKVTIVEFADYQCPFCGKFHSETYTRLIKEYVDTGKASFVYQDFAFLGEESNLAAQAAKCAGEQGKFWEYHDYLFTHQDGENEGVFVAKNLKNFARTLKLNASNFNTCLDSAKYKGLVDAETASGKAVGISGTPTVLVNGKVLVGALPYETFQQAVDQELAK